MTKYFLNLKDTFIKRNVKLKKQMSSSSVMKL